MILDRTGTSLVIRLHSEELEMIEEALREVEINRRVQAYSLLVPKRGPLGRVDTLLFDAAMEHADRFRRVRQRIRELRYEDYPLGGW